MNYDFSQLNDKEFEELVADLLTIELGDRVERFKPGKDEGVDGRLFSACGKEIIIQCKHYLKTGYSGLISKLKKEEASKVKKLNPQKYIFSTTLNLSRKNKKEILEIFTPHIKSEKDIYGQLDLNDLIKKNPKIEERHFKLWINSTNVLNRFLNNSVIGRSEFEIKEIHDKSRKYITSEAHKKAIKHIEDKRVLIISGEPGIGKTTLAENIALHYYLSDFSFYTINSSIQEAESVYLPNERQLFLYDDFLGSNFLSALENNKDAQIVKFIDRVKKDRSKVFILTSRTNIFNSGVEYSQHFNNKNLLRNEYLLTIKDYSKLDKAKILYNHIWFSKIEESYIEEIYKKKRYHEIINHKNFNPRLIEFITDRERIAPIHLPENYWQYILEILRNPKDVWKSCFNYQTDLNTRDIVLLVVLNGNRISEEILTRAYNKLNILEERKVESNFSKNFKSVIPVAVKSFLNRSSINGEIEYSLFNPSISDFILNEHMDDDEKIKSAYKALKTTESLNILSSLSNRKIINRSLFFDIIESISKSTETKKYKLDYLIGLINQSTKNPDFSLEVAKDLLNSIFSKQPNTHHITSLFYALEIYDYKVDKEEINFITEAIKNGHYTDYSEIEEIDNFIALHSLEESALKEALEQQIDQYIYDEANISSTGIDDYIIEQHDTSPSYDEDDVKKSINDKASEIFDSLSLNSHEIYNINLEIDTDSSEIEDAFSNYLSEFSRDTEIITSKSDLDSINEIDDLFDRS